jgi:diadenosine tetraphosphate (Ap4A) HIT family hydrolase
MDIHFSDDMSDCIFCKEYESKTKNIIWQGERFFTRLDNVPVSPGHIEIMPTRHIVRLEELSNEEFGGLKEAID